MSDIQEEQKRLYKKAEENDNIFLQDKIEKYKKSNKEYIELNKELYYRINKAIDYINKYCEDYVIEDSPDPMCLFYGDDGTYKPEAKQELLDILKGDNK